MKILDDVTNFFRKIFSKKENVKLIDSRIIAKSETDREVFLEIYSNVPKASAQCKQVALENIEQESRAG